QYGLDKGMHLTLHAGECGCKHNVLEAIKIGAKRIGHGVAVNLDEAALQEVKANDVLLEICPKSNLQTKAINALSEINIPYLLNKEYELLFKHQLIDLEQMKYINQRAIQYAFLTEPEKHRLLESM